MNTSLSICRVLLALSLLSALCCCNRKAPEFDATSHATPERPDAAETDENLELAQPDSNTNADSDESKRQQDSQPDTNADTDQSHPLPPGDIDADGFDDTIDNCPDAWNPDQWDSDEDSEGDACELQNGTFSHPWVIPGASPGLPAWRTTGNTCDSDSFMFDRYPPVEIEELGPEVFYLFRIEKAVDFLAYIAFPEPPDTDVDIHLVQSDESMTLLQRGNYEVKQRLEPGSYKIILDSYHNGTKPLCGAYILTVELRPVQTGTVSDPVTLSGSADKPLPLPFQAEDSRSTLDAVSDTFDTYGDLPYTESGPEIIYAFTIDQPARVAAVLRFPEPSGVDVDVHLLSAPDASALLTRGNRSVYAVLPAGLYYLTVDTYNDAGKELAGSYTLYFSARPTDVVSSPIFNDYILSAIDRLYSIYGLQGYDSAVLTHDMTYGPYGTVAASSPPKTMCVAAAMETILDAMDIYYIDNNDVSVFEFLPVESWQTLKSTNIKAHIWVNHDLNSSGTADALAHFGMGENVAFEALTPGSFINLNRTTGTGHAVVFLAFIDINGREYGFYNYSTIGFKYFSAQGGYDFWQGGLDFRYAIFEEFGSPQMPYKRDIHVIKSDNQDWLNTGVMWSPNRWTKPSPELTPAKRQGAYNPQFFDGRTE